MAIKALKEDIRRSHMYTFIGMRDHSPANKRKCGMRKDFIKDVAFEVGLKE